MKRFFSLLAALILLHTATLAQQPALQDYSGRLATFRAQIPAIVASAQHAAEMTLARPDTLLNVPYWEQTSFSEEMINRAGGLARIYPTGALPGMKPTDHDIVLFTVRSWEKQAELVRKNLQEYKGKGWTVTLIASAAGKPQDIAPDFFIDNGAPSGDAAHGRINLLANVTLGWMWCCEYGAAMSGKGKFPAILYSVAMPGADEFDAKIQTADGRYTLFPCEKTVAPGELSRGYLKRLDRLVSDLRSRRLQRQLVKAADLVAARMAAGGTVGLSGVGHVIIDEVKIDNQAPWKGFQTVGAVRTAIPKHLQPGDLLVWVAYCGMNSKYDDYAKAIAEAKVDLITCYAPHKDYPNELPTLAHIDQHWVLPDAEVPIPIYPHVMAPISGINAGLIIRMLDDEVAARLKKRAGKQ